MNILILGWRDPRHPLAGGAEQVVHEHAKGWIRAGNKVTLFSSRFKNSRKKETLDRVKIIREGHQYLGVQIAAFLFYLNHKKDFDFIIDQFHGIPFFTPLYVRKPKVALIQEVARNVWFLNPLPWPINLVTGALGYVSEPLVFLIYKKTQFMAGSESAKKDLTKFGIPLKNITVVPHGVILPKSKVEIQKQKIKTVTYLGILSKDKGIEDAIKTFALLNQKDNFVFWVIGKAEQKNYEKKIKSMARKLGLDRKVKFWGYVDRDKKFNLLAKSHALINPSIHEGWGLVNIEANSVGAPVIAYNVSGSIDSVKDGQSGLICRQNSPECLAETVLNLLADVKLYSKLQKGSLEWAGNFSWQKSRKLSLELVKRISKN